MGSASVLAFCVAGVMPAIAQEVEPVEEAVEAADPVDETATMETVVVRGIRDSLSDAQDIKRNADTFVDAVSAADITALPDRSVAETLQRIPGIAISRFAAADDPDHFSVEGSGVVVRGLTYVRSELNGRDVFSANSGRALGFNDVAPELLGSVEVFKQSTADMIEGGISGTVNLNTRKPFDSSERILAGSVEYNYGDFVEDGSFGISGIYANQWEGEFGRFGALIAYSESELLSRADGTQVADYQYFQDDGTGQPTGSPLDLFADGGDGTAPAGSLLQPLGAGVKSQNFDRDRRTIAGSLQWENPDRTILATAEYLRADATNAWNERVIETTVDQRRSVFPADGTTFGYNNSGTFTEGVLATNTGWRSNANCDGATLNSTNGAPCTPIVGLEHSLNTRGKETNTKTDDLSFNVKWSPTDRLSTNFDIQYVTSETEDFDISVFGLTYADTAIFTPDSSNTPGVQYRAPAAGDPNYFSNPDRTFWRAAMDHYEDSDGDELAYRADAEYDIDAGFIKNVRFGARFAERDQTVRWSAYNWGMLSETWNGASSPVFLSSVQPEGGLDLFGFDNFQRESVPAPVPSALFYGGDLVSDYRSGRFQGFTQSVADAVAATGGFSTYQPGLPDGGFFDGAFTPDEVTDINEQTKAFYARLDFGTDNIFGGMTLDGNIGVRYVETDFESAGANLVAPLSDIIGATGSIDAFCGVAPAAGTDPDIVCELSPAQQAELTALMTGGFTETQVSTSYENVLPSLNLKLGITDQLIARFGISQSVTRPDLGLTRAFSTLTFNRDDLTRDINAPLLQGDGGNPFLEPVLSDQVDLSLEWYFDDVGSLTASVFYKQLEDVIIASPSVQPIGNDFARVESSANSGDGEIQGFELAYQQSYDMLPGLWSGLGSQITYTFVESEGIPNNNLNPTAPTGTQPASQLETGALQGLSDHSINVVGFYENDLLSARLAYNWRSEFLLTTRDVIFPFRPIWHDDTGQLDGSLFFNVTDSVKIGVQAVNLLDETTTTFQQVDNDITLAPRSYFKNDRRFTFAIRADF